MEIFLLVTMIAVGFYTLKSGAERQRIALLGSHLGQYQIENLMERLTEGYLRALGETSPERREQVWRQLNASETLLCEQFNRFVTGFSKVGELESRVSTLAVAIPYAAKLFPAATFDLRRALAIHAQGISDAVNNRLNQSPKSRAFTLSAEMFLMQHTCHWFCKSKTVASARMLVRHKTPYALLLASVAPATRRAYEDLTGR